MASEIRVNKIENRSGLGTVTFADTGVDLAGIVTATTFSGSGASLTNLPAANVTGTLPAISGANLTNLPAANLTGALPAISGANLTGIAATDNVRTGILDVAGISTFRNTMNVGAAVTISESGIEATGVGITVANINDGKIGGRRNIMINGAFNVAQRGTSSTTPGDSFQTTDRIGYIRSGLSENTTQAQVDLSSSDTPYSLGFRKSLKLTNGNNSANAAQYQTIMTKIEADDMASSGWNYTSSSSFITFSFWVKSSVAQNFYGYLYAPNRSGGGDIYPFETGSLSADTWTKIVKTVPGHTNVTFSAGTGYGLQALIAPYFGTNYTGSTTLNQWNAYSSGGTRTPDNTATWHATNDATFETTGWQLEVGPQATPFEFRSFGDELALCQRYYYKHPITDGIGPYLTQYHSSHRFVHDFFPVTMRTTPTPTVTYSAHSDTPTAYKVCPNHYKAYAGSLSYDSSTTCLLYTSPSPRD